MRKPIRALLLAAGLGTRLRPITLKTPKCLVEINHKTILEIWLNKLEKINIMVISTSEIKISVLISKKHLVKAVAALHKEFSLNK